MRIYIGVNMNYKYHYYTSLEIKTYQKKRSDNAEPISVKESYRIENRYKDKAEFFSERISAYLCANKELFPAYCTEDEIDEVKPTQGQPSTNLYLG